jgi:hypothetical protein
MLRSWRDYLRLSKPEKESPSRANRQRRGPVRLPSRPLSQPTRYLGVVAIAKNEGRYLREWIEFQALMGAEQVYVYDNGSDDNSAEVLAPFVADRFVTTIPWFEFDAATDPQRLAYAHALCNFGPQFRWMAFIDLDEFLFPVTAPTLVEALSDYEDCSCICVPWFLFGFSGHEIPPEALTIEAYTKRAVLPHTPDGLKFLQWKSIVNPAEVVAVESPHMFELVSGRIGGVDEDRKPVVKGVSKTPPPGAVLRINHYVTRSRQEFDLKTSRIGFKIRPNRKLHALADVIEAHTVHDEVIFQFLPALHARMDAGGAGKSEKITN